MELHDDWFYPLQPRENKKNVMEEKMNNKSISLILLRLVAVTILFVLAITQIAANQPPPPTSTAKFNDDGPNLIGSYPLPSKSQHYSDHFVKVLRGGIWERVVLGPSSLSSGTFVDITPLAPSSDGAHVEHKIMPEYDGTQWVDVLWMIVPEPVKPLPVRVDVYSTADWPIVFNDTLDLDPGDWIGYVVNEVSYPGAYVIDINPQGKPSAGTGIDKAVVQVEYCWDQWWDVLRIQALPNQEWITTDVTIYNTGDQKPAIEFETKLLPGVWHGFYVGPSKDRAAYLLEVEPLNQIVQLERFVIQPEFNGETWNDVARLITLDDGVDMDVRIRIYAINK
jgi:hypothetical protein